MEAAAVERLFLRITLHRVKDLYFAKLSEAFRVLDDARLWQEPYPGANTVGGIVSHMTEHVRRSILRLTGQEHLLEAGMEIYFPNGTLTGNGLLGRHQEELEAWETALTPYINGEKELQEDHVHQLYHLTEHAGYHLGQVLDRIQGAAGVKFEFCKNGLNEQFLRSKVDGAL